MSTRMNPANIVQKTHTWWQQCFSVPFRDRVIHLRELKAYEKNCLINYRMVSIKKPTPWEQFCSRWLLCILRTSLVLKGFCLRASLRLARVWLDRQTVIRVNAILKPKPILAPWHKPFRMPCVSQQRCNIFSSETVFGLRFHWSFNEEKHLNISPDQREPTGVKWPFKAHQWKIFAGLLLPSAAAAVPMPLTHLPAPNIPQMINSNSCSPGSPEG